PPDWNDDRCRYWSVLNFDPLSTVSNGVLLSFSPPPGSPYPAGCLTYTFTASPGRQRMPVLPCNTIASPNYFLFTMIMVLPISTIDADIIINFNQTDQGRWFLCNGNNANCPFWVSQYTSIANPPFTTFQNCDICSYCICPGQRPEYGFNPVTGVGFCCPTNFLPATDDDTVCTINAVGQGGALGTCVPATGKVCAGNGDPNFGFGGTGCRQISGALQCVCRPEYIGVTCQARLSQVCGDPPCSSHGTCTFS